MSMRFQGEGQVVQTAHLKLGFSGKVQPACLMMTLAA